MCIVSIRKVETIKGEPFRIARIRLESLLKREVDESVTITCTGEKCEILGAPTGLKDKMVRITERSGFRVLSQ